MRRPKNKLQLARTTVRSLSRDELESAAGGYILNTNTSGTCTQTLWNCNGGGYTIDTNVISEIKSNCATVCYYC